jgi:hypothetical protein
MRNSIFRRFALVRGIELPKNAPAKVASRATPVRAIPGRAARATNVLRRARFELLGAVRESTLPAIFCPRGALRVGASALSGERSDQGRRSESAVQETR